MPHRAQASACGKAIIVGEHAAVYGARAIAMPLKQMSIEIDLKPVIQGLSTRQVEFKLGEANLSRHGSGVINDAMGMLHIAPFPLAIVGHSKLPVGAGLGSSAALSVVVLRALAKSLRIELEESDLARFANQLEARFHGTPSGLDTTVVAYERCICFQRATTGTNSLNIAVKSRPQMTWRFALIDSGVRASTLPMIRIAAPYFSGFNAERRIARFDRLSLQVMTGLEEGDVPAVADAMNESAGLLKKTGIVTPQLDDIVVKTKKAGLLAAKTTGAGGGGFVLALIDPQSMPGQQLDTLRQLFGESNVFPVDLP